jgi:hypothetical protein
VRHLRQSEHQTTLPTKPDTTLLLATTSTDHPCLLRLSLKSYRRTGCSLPAFVADEVVVCSMMTPQTAALVATIIERAKPITSVSSYEIVSLTATARPSCGP